MWTPQPGNNPQYLVSICVSLKLLSSCLQPITRVICAWDCIPRGLLQENVIMCLWCTYYGQTTKTSQGNQLASAPYKHHLHGKDCINHPQYSCITQINPKNNFPYRDVKYVVHVCFHFTRALLHQLLLLVWQKLDLLSAKFCTQMYVPGYC